MNTLQRWWERFDIFAVPVVVILFLLLGYQGGAYMAERKCATASATELARITQDHTAQVEDLRVQVENERRITMDKDRRLRSLQNRQLRMQDKQTQALDSAIKATESATKAIEKISN
jgi:hypothetical protein